MGFSYIQIVVSEEAVKVVLYGKREMKDAQEKEYSLPYGRQLRNSVPQLPS